MSTSRAQNPYVGPRSFEEGETSRFFGRERELGRLVNLLIARRLVLLHAPSGAGKTSLINAALIPRLRAEGFLVHRPVRLNAAVPPEAVAWTPNRFELATILALDEELPPEQRIPSANLARADLRSYLDWRGRANPADEVLIFDQFEELLTTDAANRAAKETFLAALGAALENPRRWALFAIREDYLGNLRPMLLRLPTRLDALFRLDLLDPTQARRAIQGPALGAGVAFADEAAAAIVDDLRRSTVQRPDGSGETVLGQVVEPVQLQVVCYRLWERTAGDEIGTADMERAGDVDAALGAYYAERMAAVAASTGVDERTVRDWVEVWLITAGGLRSQVLREAGATGGLRNETILRLVDAHLLRAEERRGATWYELAHDRLVGPVRQDNTVWFAANLSTLQRQARLWERDGRPDGLLLRGAALEEATSWARAHGDDLTEGEQALLRESLALHAQEQRERRQASRLRLLAWVAFCFGAGASILALAAFWFYTQAELARGQAVEAAATAIAANQAAADAGRTAVVASTAERVSYDNSERARWTAEAGATVIASALTLAEEERQRADQAARRSAEQALVADSESAALNGDADRALALALAVDPDAPGAALALASAGEVAGTRLRLLDLQGTVLTVAISPDGRYAAAGSSDGFIGVWDLADGRPLWTARVHDDDVQALRFTPDGRSLISGGNDGVVSRTDVASGGSKRLVTLEEDKAIYSLDLSPNGRTLLVTTLNGSAQLRSLDSGESLGFQQASSGFAAFSPAGDSIILSEGELGTVAALYGLDGRLVQRFGGDNGHQRAIQAVALTPDGATALSASQDGTIKLWDVGTGELLRTLTGHQASVWGMAVAADGSRLLTSSADGTIRLWSLQTADTINPELRSFRGHAGSVYAVALATDGAHILSGGEDGSVRWWDLKRYAALGELEAEASIQGVAVSADGRRAFALTVRGELSAWDVNTGAARGPGALLLSGAGRSYFALAVSPDGRTIAVGDDRGTIYLGELDGSLAPLQGEGAHLGTIQSLAFSPDGALLISTAYGANGAADGNARVWQVAERRLERVLQAEDATLLVAIITSEGIAIAGGEGGMLYTWDVASGQLEAPFEGVGEVVLDLAVTADGTTLAVAATNGTVQLWRVAGRKLVSTLSSQGASAWSVAFSTGAPYLAAGFNNGQIRVWDTQRGEEVSRISAHQARLWAVALSGDGRVLLSGGADQYARAWQIRSPVALADWLRANRYVETLPCDVGQRYQPLQIPCTSEP